MCVLRTVTKPSETPYATAVTAKTLLRCVQSYRRTLLTPKPLLAFHTSSDTCTRNQSASANIMMWPQSLPTSASAQSAPTVEREQLSVQIESANEIQYAVGQDRVDQKQRTDEKATMANPLEADPCAAQSFTQQLDEVTAVQPLDVSVESMARRPRCLCCRCSRRVCICSVLVALALLGWAGCKPRRNPINPGTFSLTVALA